MPSSESDSFYDGDGYLRHHPPMSSEQALRALVPMYVTLTGAPPSLLPLPKL